MKISRLMELGRKDFESLSPELQRTYRWFEMHSNLPRRNIVSAFCEFPKNEQEVFLLCKQLITKEYPDVQVWATGSRVHGAVSEEEIRMEDGTLIRKKSDYDIWVLPAFSPETSEALQRKLREATGEKIDITPIPPGHYFPVLIP